MNAGAEWDYLDKLKKLTDDQLYKEYTRINAELDNHEKPYAQRSRRKHDGRLDADFQPEEPPYDNFVQPNPKKRKKPAVAKNMKRKRNLPSSADVADFGLTNKRVKKRKREEGLDGPRKFPRNSSNARRKNVPITQDSDEDLGGHSLKRRKLDETDEELSESSDFERGPVNEYSNLTLHMIVQKYVDYSKRLERLNIQKFYDDKFKKLHQDNLEADTQKQEFEEELENIRSEKHALDLDVSILKKKLQAKEEALERHKAAAKERNNKLTSKMMEIKQQAEHGGFQMDDTERSQLLKQNSDLVAQNRALKQQLNKLQKQGTSKVPGDTPLEQIQNQLWVEQKFSKELQTHYKELVDITGKISRDTKQPDQAQEQRLRDLQQQNAQLRQKTMQLENQNKSKSQEIAKLKELLKQSNQMKNSGRRNRKNERKQKTIPPQPVSKKVTKVGAKDFNEDELKTCAVCRSNLGDLYKIANPYYKKDKPTFWSTVTPGSPESMENLVNQPYCFFHKRCSRGDHMKNIAELLFVANPTTIS